MATRVIMLVVDRDDPKHGEITVLDDMRKAENLVATLLEAGFEQERIRIFTGSEMGMRVTHRPVVTIVNEEQDEIAAADHSSAEPQMEPETEEEASGEAETATPQQEGVRFSSLFRSS